MGQYVALIRGINVGGNHLIKMAALKACFEQQGFANVATYIQSGNVLFETKGRASKKLASIIEDAIAAMFDCRTSVVLRSSKELRDIVEQAPRSFGASPTKYRYDVVFLREPLTAAKAIVQVPTKPGVDLALAGKGVIYFSRLISKASESRLSKIVSLALYKDVTIRNWNTTTKLLRLMDAKGDE